MPETPTHREGERGQAPGWLLRAVQGLVLLGTLGLTFGLGGWLAVRMTVRRTPDIAVPRLIGQDVAAVQEQLRASGLVPEIVGRRFDPREPEGKVLSQVPGPGSSTRPGRPVRLIVSLGTRRATVPELTGSSEGRAQLALRGAGLASGAVLHAPDPSVAAGRVLGQHPPAGTIGAPGDKVELVVSTGPRPRRYVMPLLVGRNAGEVAAALSRRGFRVRQQGTGGPTVIEQDPRPGVPVTTQDPITLTTGGSGPLPENRP